MIQQFGDNDNYQIDSTEVNFMQLACESVVNLIREYKEENADFSIYDLKEIISTIKDLFFNPPLIISKEFNEAIFEKHMAKLIVELFGENQEITVSSSEGKDPHERDRY